MRKLLIVISLLMFSSGIAVKGGKRHERKNYHAIIALLENIASMEETSEKLREKVEGIKQELKAKGFEAAIIQLEIDAAIKKRDSDALLIRKEAHTKFFFDLPKVKGQEQEVVYNEFLNDVFNKDAKAFEESEIHYRGIEYLLETAIEDLALTFGSFLSKDGLKVLSSYLTLIDYALHYNEQSLFNFLIQKKEASNKKSHDSEETVDNEKGEEKWENLLTKENLESFSSLDDEKRYSFLVEALVLPFNMYLGGPFKGWFACDVKEDPSSCEQMLKALRSDAKNFRESHEPENFEAIFGRMITKTKHYLYLFFDNLYIKRPKDEEGEGYINYFYIMGHLLSSERSTDWKQGFETPLARREIAKDFLENCANTSNRRYLNLGSGWQSLDVAPNCQWGPKGCIDGSKCGSENCFFKRLDSCFDDEQYIYQSILSLAPFHKKAEDLFGSLYFDRKILDRLLAICKGLLFRCFWHNKIDKYEDDIFDRMTKVFPGFVENHPECVIDDMQEYQAEKAKYGEFSMFAKTDRFLWNAANFLLRKRIIIDETFFAEYQELLASINKEEEDPEDEAKGSLPAVLKNSDEPQQNQ